MEKDLLDKLELDRLITDLKRNHLTLADRSEMMEDRDVWRLNFELLLP